MNISTQRTITRIGCDINKLVVLEFCEKVIQDRFATDFKKKLIKPSSSKCYLLWKIMRPALYYARKKFRAFRNM